MCSVNMFLWKFYAFKIFVRCSFRFLMGKNKVLQIGLGRTAEDEADDNLHKVSEQLVGERGLLFTDESIEDLLE